MIFGTQILFFTLAIFLVVGEVVPQWHVVVANRPLRQRTVRLIQISSYYNLYFL